MQPAQFTGGCQQQAEDHNPFWQQAADSGSYAYARNE